MVGSRYTHGHESAVLFPHARRTVENSCGYLVPHLNPGMNVLDVGCGPGSITLDLTERVAPGRVTGIEPVEEPLMTARESARERGDATTVFELGDVFSLRYADASFDLVHAHQVLQHLPDPVAALREMHRVCAPGGLMAVRDADYSGMFWHPQPTGMDRWMETYQRIARHNGGDPDAGRRLRAWTRAAGLDDIVISVSTWVYATPESTQWWGESQADRVRGNQFVAQATAEGVPTDQVEAMAQAWTEWGASEDAIFVMPHVEMLVRKAR